jgi:hypothetical protein
VRSLESTTDPWLSDERCRDNNRVEHCCVAWSVAGSLGGVGFAQWIGVEKGGAKLLLPVWSSVRWIKRIMRWRGDETRRDGSQPSTHAAGWGGGPCGAQPPLHSKAGVRQLGEASARRLRGCVCVSVGTMKWSPPAAPTRDPGNATAASGRGKGRGTLVPAACGTGWIDRGWGGWLAW